MSVATRADACPFSSAKDSRAKTTSSCFLPDCVRADNGVIRDIPWSKTFITKSVESQRDIVPIHFGGRNSNRFYRLANLCKFFGIKFNIAMLYLVDEMFLNRHKTFVVKIGKPIPWQTFDKSRSATEWAAYVQNIVYQL